MAFQPDLPKGDGCLQAATRPYLVLVTPGTPHHITQGRLELSVVSRELCLSPELCPRNCPYKGIGKADNVQNADVSGPSGSMRDASEDEGYAYIRCQTGTGRPCGSLMFFDELEVPRFSCCESFALNELW